MTSRCASSATQTGAPGYEVSVGGGLGRTPMIGKAVRDFVPKADLLPYIEAILQVYNFLGRRDNKYKARLKILVHEAGIDEVRARIEAAFEARKATFPGVNAGLLADDRGGVRAARVHRAAGRGLRARLCRRSGVRVPGSTPTSPRTGCDDYAIATISLKPIGGTPGDIDRGADAAGRRPRRDLRPRRAPRRATSRTWCCRTCRARTCRRSTRALRGAGLATANIGLISDIIACPGMDYCSLATARSIPMAQQIAETFADLDRQRDIGALKIKISGCINACGHHHVGHIGILGLDRAGVENYQITLGGDGTETAAVGEKVGPGFAYDEIVPAVERLIEAYLDLRLEPGESFLEAYRRVGAEPFKVALYGEEARSDAA